MFEGVLNMFLLKSKGAVRCLKRTMDAAKYVICVDVCDIFHILYLFVCFEIFQ